MIRTFGSHGLNRVVDYYAKIKNAVIVGWDLPRRNNPADFQRIPKILRYYIYCTV